MAGTLTWQRLDTTDPVKLAAIFDAARHHILRVDMTQEAMAAASRSVAASTKWRTVGHGRPSCYIPREKVTTTS